ncbi:MAG: SMC-Scp complex subunit ScpB [Candidatus Paceibacterota bacterium]|jgi:segregation and condensation protein B
MQNDNIEQKIEAVLFWKGEPISMKKLSEIFGKTEEEIKQVLNGLEASLAGRGLSLVFKEDEVTLGTSKETSEIIEKLTKEELVRDLGRAGLETLSIVVYQGPIAKSEIDYIRGVQSNFILRNLMIRGLIERVPNPKDMRSFLYKPTFDMLAYMGITKIEEMPEYALAKQEIESYKNNAKVEEEKQVAEDAVSSEAEI